MSGAHTERPVNRYQPPDWHSRNEKLAFSARETREQSLNLRKESQFLKIETENKTKWFNFENNMKLSQRAMEIERWQQELVKLFREVSGEYVVLEDAKEACEKTIEALAIPLEVATECISLREARREYEVVRDPVEFSLQKENQLIEKIRVKLKDICEDAWDQLAVLDDVKNRLETDIEDKTEALRIDLDQLQLTERSSGLSHKPNPTRIPSKSVRPEAWNDFSMSNKALAERELVKSQKLREFIFHHIEQTTNELKVLTDNTNFDFRKRMYEIRRAKDEIEYQMKTTKDEIEEQEDNNRELELAIQAKEGPLKLAETRLENRTSRPHVELCTDLPLEGLVAEVEALRKSINMLEDKLDHSRETLSTLQAHLRDLTDDYNRKAQALSIDQRCVDMRRKLLTHDQAVKSQTERNMKLSGTLRKTQRYLENSTVAK